MLDWGEMGKWLRLVSACLSAGAAQRLCLHVGQSLEEKHRGSTTVQSYSVGGEMFFLNVTLHYSGVFMTDCKNNLSHAL